MTQVLASLTLKMKGGMLKQGGFDRRLSIFVNFLSIDKATEIC